MLAKMDLRSTPSAQFFGPEQVSHLGLAIGRPSPIASAVLVVQVLKLDPAKPAILLEFLYMEDV